MSYTGLKLELSFTHLTIPLVRVDHHIIMTFNNKRCQLQVNSFIDICLVLLLGRHNLHDSIININQNHYWKTLRHFPVCKQYHKRTWSRRIFRQVCITYAMFPTPKAISQHHQFSIFTDYWSAVIAVFKYPYLYHDVSSWWQYIICLIILSDIHK